MTTHYERRGQTAVLQIDNPPVNGLGQVTRRTLIDGLGRALHDDAVKAIVITGTGNVFSGGADIKEFNTPAALAEPNLLQVIDNVERSPKPVIAAINGVCMGGGLELALGCHYRIATTDAALGLPEVKIGLLPGAGGTQRLPRAVGAAKALQMIVRGDPIVAKDALQHGLIEQIVDKTAFEGVLRFADKVSGQRTHPKLRDRTAKLPDGQASNEFFTKARDDVLTRSRGLPASIRCVEAVAAAVDLPFAQGLAVERGFFDALVQSSESKGLRHAFFAERAAAKVSDVPDGTPTRSIKSAAVIGFGTMGAGIAMSFANAGIAVTVFEKEQAALDRGLATCRRNWDATAKKGRLTADQVVQRMTLLRPTLEFDALGSADIVIEAAYEDMAVKQHLFKQLDAVMKRGAILATNTSTLDVDQIAAVTARPQDVIGTHFFSPANVMRLLEIVRGKRTSKEVLATVMQLAKRLKKVGVVSGVCDGFIGNRMLEHYLRQSMFLIDEGASPQQIDAAMTNFGMAMGPFAVGDLAGLDIGHAIRQRRYVEKPGTAYSRVGDRVVELGRLGQKTSKGWYRYEAGNRTPRPDPEVSDLIARYRAEIGLTPRTIDDDEIVQRCVYALVNEGARILEEGIALRASDIDVVYLTGYGFPATKGGPMFYAQTVGLERVVKSMRGFADNEHADPQFWQPAELLSESARNGSWPR
ncbi:MAG: 3-hydroxyacyl-CoA dehydrogenase NAD-binding domain-containing protein [Burkholderiaceae bacterium]